MGSVVAPDSQGGSEVAEEVEGFQSFHDGVWYGGVITYYSMKMEFGVMPRQERFRPFFVSGLSV
jgi:hypothetical protein